MVEAGRLTGGGTFLAEDDGQDADVGALGDSVVPAPVTCPPAYLPITEAEYLMVMSWDFLVMPDSHESYFYLLATLYINRRCQLES